jgi:hypothetical protein
VGVWGSPWRTGLKGGPTAFVANSIDGCVTRMRSGRSFEATFRNRYGYRTSKTKVLAARYLGRHFLLRAHGGQWQNLPHGFPP